MSTVFFANLRTLSIMFRSQGSNSAAGVCQESEPLVVSGNEAIWGAVSHVLAPTPAPSSSPYASIALTLTLTLTLILILILALTSFPALIFVFDK
jgi:hypothetical protein